jgi:hypothetical protein
MKNNNYVIPKEIATWWATGLQDFIKYVHQADSGEGMFAYVKSCQYTEESEVKLREEFNLLIYTLLDEINELKEHNYCLSERILFLENKPPLII